MTALSSQPCIRFWGAVSDPALIRKNALKISRIRLWTSLYVVYFLATAFHLPNVAILQRQTICIGSNVRFIVTLIQRRAETASFEPSADEPPTFVRAKGSSRQTFHLLIGFCHLRRVLHRPRLTSRKELQKPLCCPNEDPVILMLHWLYWLPVTRNRCVTL